MDFPIFHIDFIGNRLLIAVDAILHVLINHAFAIGALPIVVLLEYTGIRHGDPRWDTLAYRLLKVVFIVTTTVGALTGVGIWFSAALVNPAAIGSLIRVFFWGWFVEWIVFVSEVSLIMLYFLSWPNSTESAQAKRRHMRFGVMLAAFSWITMAIIVAILGFMMDPGDWHEQQSLWAGLFNPMYLPQLAFRTSLAMVMGGMTMMAFGYWFTDHDTAFREGLARTICVWTALWTGLLAIAAWWYSSVVPAHMLANIPVAITTQAYTDWLANFKWVLIAGLLFVGWVLADSLRRPGRLHGGQYVAAALVLCVMLGQFERVREFIRKPFIIGNYMYANGIRVADYPLLRRDGILKHAVYAGVRDIRSDNQTIAGREVFQLTCTRCHTVKGVNGIRAQLVRMYGDQRWNADVIAAYLENMHGARYFMPPFPGNQEELTALAVYLASLQNRAQSYEGVQVTGIPKPDHVAASTHYGSIPDLTHP
ncbi:c-type cytochrome [Methylomonas sp. CM2]|uniref:cytochrome c n=1 Tax=Methylomonas sp. CM2 TaxID=3417647 RepID=UPI003CF5368F